ncbi:DNA repair protein RecN [Tenacibaculum finnmarkense genomovar finnmarkense]|uniref:DNA repair protein RecN n=1 Tax=Tenacibaculum finnmarkense TaxID=2781243 RepID=UPI001E4DE8CC|nr:DNA repair protein RecN [Tenacibaculum finnmarkense]MCD8418436.1 DNA repair protein RecN [Tenacibaculum finnmarkense genomovar finnmarkense]MCG8186728.1 DNA repair protein RecN [Tenacibaculum finnmarkense genomovar finnmarkense]MCG8203246.1 DNA repair protein RecN [Tenacibaculum finnmarkense genomovar finnmarkense]MCG8210635.1 DNA repair protein RecN [Tenacibaculum finnmarkense genomovar finnmarkense]MCG8213472.1 DNA repair protein RecN [Tenacibaculum finnmarkense genomovar finnmarkense]
MLRHLSIYNYALINQLSIDFTKGLSIITGETGAGKSILLGALGLVMGNRADLSSLKNTDKKCIIEAKFAVEGYSLQHLFDEFDLDYEPETIIRREILPSGKSRAFVNDTPVNLSILTALKIKLLDIHSQHQTAELSDTSFQFSIIDALAKNKTKVTSYKTGMKKYTSLVKELKILKEKTLKSKEQYAYNSHLFNEFEQAELVIGEQEVLEEKLHTLNNVEEIKLHLSEALAVSSNEEIGVQNLLYSLENSLQKISAYAKNYQEITNRVTSLKLEFDDVVAELENANEEVAFNPNEVEELNDRLQLIYNLQKKHSVNSIAELLVIFESLSEKVAQVDDADELIAAKNLEITAVTNKLDEFAVLITASRNKAIPKLQKELEYLLTELGMPNARFSMELIPSDSYFYNGKDVLSFLFSANKGGNFGELKKVASGGELSRIMLSVKKILSENIQLPTIIFDEIDTGVSGEVSNKIAKIMQDMGAGMQVITITHLPQIAAKGVQHYKVYKGEENGVTTSNLKLLSEQERIIEIAEMLSGKDVSESALIHAKELLN